MRRLSTGDKKKFQALAIAIGALAAVLLASLLWQQTEQATLIIVAAIAAVAITLIGAPAGFGRTAGLATLWAVLLLSWFAMLNSAFSSHGWQIVPATQRLPGRFVYWSLAAVPLAAATHFTLPGGPLRFWYRAGAVGWLIFLVVNLRISMRAVDVGDYPLQPGPLLWAYFSCVALSPVLMSLGQIRRCILWDRSPAGRARNEKN